MKDDRPVPQTELAKSGAERRMDQQGCGPAGRRAGSHLLELVSDGLGLLVPLEPHHILGVEPPRLLLQCLGRKVLRLSALQIVEDEEEGLSGQALVELHSVRVRGRHLVVVGGRRAGVPGQVLPDALRV